MSSHEPGLVKFIKKSVLQTARKIFNDYGYGIEAEELIKRIGIISKKEGFKSFLVGGFPRDVIIYILKSYHKRGVSNISNRYKTSEIFSSNSKFLDLDVATDGDPEKLAFSIKNNARFLKIHKRFGTASIEYLAGGIPLKTDIAALRTESYACPGVLPQVNTGKATLKDDVIRRDFTINTLAFSINPEDFLELKDYIGGLSDIFKKKIRVLHALSFIDDPTRIFRAVRFEKRLKFRIDGKTLELLKAALDENVLDKISGKRITAELTILLKEKKPEIYLARLDSLGVLSHIYGKLRFTKKNKIVFSKISNYFDNPKNISVSRLRRIYKEIEADIFYKAEIFSGLNNTEFNEAAKRLNMGGKVEKTLKTMYSGLEMINNLEKNNFLYLNKKPAEIYDNLDKICIRSILFYLFQESGKDAAGFNFRRIAVKYINKVIFIKPSVNGNDIRALGICEGPLYGKILSEIKNLKISGKLKSKEDEIKYIKEKYLKNN